MAETFMGDLDPSIVEKIRQVGSSRTYPARSYIFYEGDPGTGVYVVESGLLRIDRSTPTGKIALLDLAITGALIGDLAVIDGAPRSATLASVTEVRIRHVPAREFQALLRDDPSIQAALLQRLARRIRALSSQFLETSTMDSPSRIAARILRLVDIEQTFGRSKPDADGAIDLKLPISQEEVGQWAGLSREGTGKGLSVLRSLGIIETGRKRVKVLDLARLTDMAASA